MEPERRPTRLAERQAADVRPVARPALRLLRRARKPPEKPLWQSRRASAGRPTGHLPRFGKGRAGKRHKAHWHAPAVPQQAGGPAHAQTAESKTQGEKKCFESIQVREEVPARSRALVSSFEARLYRANIHPKNPRQTNHACTPWLPRHRALACGGWPLSRRPTA